MIKTRKPDLKVPVDGVENCKSKCLEKCPPCQAYSYAPVPLTQRTLNPSTCWIWTHNLTTLKENYTDGDDYRRLFVLVDKSDI
ncbi:G-type lectin S-receptor-like serine/threonine-protein kinase, partial [Trifolium medium]|nr:G-type lectin S-receptor-like serine/threonine-protein kinase [Trifolium medium]